MKPTPYDHFAYEYNELFPLFATIVEDPDFIAFEPETHRAHLELYQRNYSFWFHNTRSEKWRKAFSSSKTGRRMWHVRTDAYLAHLVQNGIVHRETRDAYADTLSYIRHQNKHLSKLCRCLLSDVYRGPRPTPNPTCDVNPENVIAFELL